MIYRLGSEHYLRALRAEDLDGAYPGWFEDQETCRYNSHGKFFPSRVALASYVEEAATSTDRIVLAICHDTDGHVGNVSLQAISVVDRSAEFAILLGDRRHWGRDLGYLAGRAVFAHGFDKLGLERIHCGTAAGNEGMRRLALKLGMTHEGTRRKAVFLEGAREDLLEFGILRGEFSRDD